MNAAVAIDDVHGIRAVYLQPGQLFASAEPARITTILGSCIAVGMWDDERGIGGINHFMLPVQPAALPPSDRFGNHAMRHLVDRLAALGARPLRLRAKVFGGACVLGNLSTGAEHLGDKNLRAAQEFLDSMRIPIVAQETGGTRGIKLIFHTRDGVALLKRV